MTDQSERVPAEHSSPVSLHWVFIIFIIITMFNRDSNYIHYYSA